MLIYVLRWRPAWISDRLKKHNFAFCSDMKFKMAATAGLSLTLDPMGKMFQNASSLKPLRQLKPNCPGMIIGRFEFHIRTKNVKFVEDHPMNIHVQFGFNHICSF
jgi:hypothetical protein